MLDPIRTTMQDHVLVLADIEAALGEEIKLVLMASAAVIIVLTVTLSTTIRKSIATKQREQTKRELAAYIAEGSMSPDDAHRILMAGEGDDIRELVLKRAADGWISAKKADQIIKTLNAEQAKHA